MLIFIILLLLLLALALRVVIVLATINKGGSDFCQEEEGKRILRSHPPPPPPPTRNSHDNRPGPVKTLVVLGSGGHTTEMLHLLSSFEEVQTLTSTSSDVSTTTTTSMYTPLSYIVASTDTTSINRLGAFEQNTSNSSCSSSSSSPKLKLPKHDAIYTIPRAREVGQSYFTSVFTTIYSILYTANIVLIKTRPDLILINGPGTCLPVALWGFVLRILSPNINININFNFSGKSTTRKSRSRTKGKIVFIESFCRVKTLSLTGKILWKLRICDLILVHWPELLQLELGMKAEQRRMILIDSFIQHNANENENETASPSDATVAASSEASTSVYNASKKDQ